MADHHEKCLEDLNMVFSVERKQFTLSGLYPLPVYNFFYNIRTVVLFFFSSLLVFSMLITLGLGVDDLSKVTDILYYLMTQAAYLWKLINFTIGRRKVLLIEEHLKHPVLYKYLRKHGSDYLRDAAYICSLAALTFRISVVILVLFYGIYPLFDKDPEKNLPFAGWFPVDKVKYRAPIYTLQMSCLFVSGFTNSSIDIFTAYMITIAIAILKTMKKCLNETDYADSPDSEITSSDLGTIVALHEHVLVYITMIEDMFSYGIFIQFLASIGVICLTGFQMLVVPFKSAQFLMLTSYIACMMCQVAMYCWYGNEILTESDDIGNACYMSNWYEGTNSSKKVLFLIMERAKRDIKLTAGKFFTLSLATLLMILKSSYSYFAVLQRIYKED